MKIKIWAPFAPTKALFKFEGGGAAIEQFIDITEAEKWVEYTVDFSKAAGTSHTKVLLAFHPFTTPVSGTFYFDDIRGVEAKDVFETFETGNEMGWNALDGTLEAPIDNPAPNRVNSTAKVGKYTKSGAHAYSLLLAERATPFDMSVLNQFKMQIQASAPTQVLLKLEGDGPAVEKIANIGVVNAWQEYTFEFSDLLEEGLDVGIRIAHLEDSSLIALPLGEIRRVIVASPAFLREHGRPRHPNDLLKANCVRLVGYAPHWGHFRESGKTFKLTVNGNLEFNHIAPAVQACADGAGFGQFLSYQVAPLLQSGALETVLDAFADAPRPIHVVYPHARLLLARTRALSSTSSARNSRASNPQTSY